MTAPRDLVLGTAGHIDHGKTALVRALTGVDTDRLPAEKARGISIDLGFAALELGSHRLAVVDVPGHERFIRNMLAGASGIDLAMLVVAADDSVMPQTREHLEILRLLGLTGGVVAITKADLADQGWTDLVEEEIRAITAGTFLSGAAIVRTSARTGQGLDRLRAELERAASHLATRDDPGLFRMAIDRVFSRPGLGTVVTGTVASGSIGVDDEVAWMPEGRIVRARGLHRHDRAVDRVGRGARAAVNLGGVHHAEVRRGHELGSPGYLRPSRILGVEVVASADAPRPLRHRGRYRLHLGASEIGATLVLLSGDAMTPGQATLGQFLLAEPVVAVSGQPFVIREESPPATLGGGLVREPNSTRRIRRRDLAARSRLEKLGSRAEVDRVAAALTTLALRPWTQSDLCREADVAIDRVPDALARLRAAGALLEIPSGPRRLIDVPIDTASAWEARLLRALERRHRIHPRHSGIRRTDLRAAFPDVASDATVAAILDRLIARGAVVGDGEFVALAAFTPRLSHSERALKATLAESLNTGGFSPPGDDDLIARTGAKKAVAAELLALLVDEGRAVVVAPGLHLDSAAECAMRRRVSDHLADGRAMTVSDLRDLLGTSRKFAVPLAEYLDRIGLTRREGDLRRLASVAGEAAPNA